LSDLCPGPEVFAAWAVSLATSLRSFAAGIVPTQGAVSHRSQPRATIGIQRVADNPAGVIEPKTAFLRTSWKSLVVWRDFCVNSPG
jgi:hypothetical protein